MRAVEWSGFVSQHTVGIIEGTAKFVCIAHFKHKKELNVPHKKIQKNIYNGHTMSQNV